MAIFHCYVSLPEGNETHDQWTTRDFPCCVAAGFPSQNPQGAAHHAKPQKIAGKSHPAAWDSGFFLGIEKWNKMNTSWRIKYTKSKIMTKYDIVSGCVKRSWALGYPSLTLADMHLQNCWTHYENRWKSITSIQFWSVKIHESQIHLFPRPMVRLALGRCATAEKKEPKELQPHNTADRGGKRVIWCDL